MQELSKASRHFHTSESWLFLRRMTSLAEKGGNSLVRLVNKLGKKSFQAASAKALSTL